MSFTTPVYSPTDGLKNTISFPTTPASEAAARKQIQDMLDQVTTLLKALIDELESVTTGSSGAENIGSAAIENVTGTTVRTQLADLKTQLDAIVAGSVSDGSITTAKLAGDAVDGTKIADDSIDSEHYVDGSIDTAHIADGAVTAGKLGATSILEANIATGAVTAGKIGTGAVIEGKIGTGAVTQTKIADGSVTAAKLAAGARASLVVLDTWWSVPWTSGQQLVTRSSEFERLLVYFENGSTIQVSRNVGGNTYSGATCGVFNASIDTLKLHVVSGDTLEIYGHVNMTFSNDAHPIVQDSILGIVAIYGIY